MATLERPYPSAPLEQLVSSPAAAFDPLDVPRGPFTAPASTAQGIYSEDLIDLGEEQLFTGQRRATVPEGRNSGEGAVREASGSSTPVISEEVVRSLGAAKQAFLFALNGLLQEFLLEEEHDSPDPSTSHLAQPLPHRHSVTESSPAEPVSYPSLSSAHDPLLSSLLHDLRLHTDRPSYSPRSTASSPLLGTLAGGEAGTEELEARIDSIAAELPPQDAELARSLGSLLACIDRLLSVSEANHDLEPAMALAPDVLDSPNVYATLEREARALRSNKDQWTRGEADAVVGAAREVESAERDLLWGRLDDLADRVGGLCRQRAAAAVREEVEASLLEKQLWRIREGSIDGFSFESAELPSYSHDTAHHPPAYLADHPTDLGLDEKGRTSTDTLSSTIGVRRTAHNEKMQRDLESVSEAIERLYVVSPQLANQRVEPDRRLLRERQLAKLGNAIERLSKGRLNNQRAALTALAPERPEEKAARLVRIKDAAQDNLIDQIDRAASGALANQRVDLKKGKSVLRDYSMEAATRTDPDERQRREFILEHTGKGRLASQDAVWNPSGFLAPSTLPNDLEAASLSISEFFRNELESRPRSNSLPGGPIRKKFSGMFQKNDDEAGSSKKSPLRLNVFRKGSSPSMSRRGSYDSRIAEAEAGSGSRSPGNLDIRAVSPLDFVAEEFRNLSSVVVSFWPRTATPGSASDWEVVAVEAEALLVAPTIGGPASRLPLPCRVIPQAVPVTSHGAFFEVKLATVLPSPTRSRHDLEVHAPLSTAELRDSLPTSYACAKCHDLLVDSSSVLKYNALPSEYWAELMDAWMCHQDQTLSDDLIEKGKGIKPREGEGLVGSSYIVFHRDITRNWSTPEKSEATRSEADDLLSPAHCNACNSLIGQHVTSLSPLPSPTYLRLLKYATYPLAPAASPATDKPSRKALRQYSLSTHVMAEMLEIGQAHACHRFAVEDAETEQVRVLLWLFNPAVRVSFSTASAAGSLLDESSQDSGSANGTSARQITRTLNAVKVFYTVVEDEADPLCQEFVTSVHSTTERIGYPLDVTRRLTELLRASSSVYPLGKRTWGDMEAGFLERI